MLLHSTFNNHNHFHFGKIWTVSFGTALAPLAPAPLASRHRTVRGSEAGRHQTQSKNYMPNCRCQPCVAAGRRRLSPLLGACSGTAAAAAPAAGCSTSKTTTAAATKRVSAPAFPPAGLRPHLIPRRIDSRYSFPPPSLAPSLPHTFASPAGSTHTLPSAPALKVCQAGGRSNGGLGGMDGMDIDVVATMNRENADGQTDRPRKLRTRTS